MMNQNNQRRPSCGSRESFRYVGSHMEEFNNSTGKGMEYWLWSARENILNAFVFPVQFGSQGHHQAPPKWRRFTVSPKFRHNQQRPLGSIPRSFNWPGDLAQRLCIWQKSWKTGYESQPSLLRCVEHPVILLGWHPCHLITPGQRLAWDLRGWS